MKNIICDKNFRNKNNIPDRFIIICACNPYRILSEENQNLEFGMSIEKYKRRKLVYTVNPLPYSTLNFILDFNNLENETTKIYIKNMSNKRFPNISNNIRELITELVEKSHYFIKERSDISSVSLREINRFPKFYNYFIKYLNINRKLGQREIDSIILSLYFCYYLRIPTRNLRKEYINKIINSVKFNNEIIPFLEVTKRESDYITDKLLEGKIGYAKNKGLSENLFSEFICLNNKEPLIICGKPGSSKSLSVRILLDAMKGNNSRNEFLKQFKEIIPSFYQCSLSSTSQSVLKVFERARKKLKYKNNNIISLVFMDEMGIADESQNNPLKVIHSELDNNIEIEREEEKISFIGITNWSLDASKMNRAINVVVEEPDLDYLIETSKEIIRIINKDLIFNNEELIKAICEAYLNYKNDYLPQNNKEDFHGYRDFYYLIKYIFYNISENP